MPIRDMFPRLVAPASSGVAPVVAPPPVEAPPFAAVPGVVVQVNAVNTTRLWDAGGERHIDVANEDVDYWLAQGFRRDPIDVRSTLEEFVMMAAAASTVVQAYVADALAAGTINTDEAAAKHVAEIAMRDLDQKWIQLHMGLQRLLPSAPTPEPEPPVRDNGT